MVNPVSGMRLVTPPTTMNNWIASAEASPAASSLPKLSRTAMAVRRPGLGRPPSGGDDVECGVGGLEDPHQALEDAGVHVVVSDAQDIEGTYAAIRMIGALLGKNEEAETVIDGMKTTFESLKGVCGDGEKTIYFEVSPLEYGLWTAGANTFMNEIAELLGLKNCFADVEGWAEISEEQVLERNPDYIMTISMYFGEGPTPEEEIASRAGWENVTAVKNGAILNLQNNELSRPAPRLAEGAQMLADFIAGVEANDKAA